MNRLSSPAVILGLSETGLAVARSLAARGVSVHGVVFGKALSHGQFSRRLQFHRGPEFISDDEPVSFLTNLAERIGGKPVLCVTGDENLLFLYRNRETLAPHYRFLVWESPRLLELASKRSLATLGSDLGLPVPATRCVSSHDEVVTACDDIGLPCIAKPEYTHLWESELARQTCLGYEKAVSLRCTEDVQRVGEAIDTIGKTAVIQRMIEGPDENHVEFPALVDASGQLRAGFVAKKIRVSPPYMGMGCLVESFPSVEVEATAREILSALDYRGLGMVQFKRDSQDGKLYLLEINPRFTVWTGLPVACGVDLPWYYYALCADLPLEVKTEYEAGVRWINAERDFFTARTYIRNGQLTWWRWLRDVVTTRHSAYFSWTDPLPGLYSCYRVISRVLGALRRKFSR